MTDCDASVVASQYAVLFGLVAIAAVGLGLGWKGLSFEFLCGFCMLTDWTAFSPERGSTLSCSAMGRKTQGGAMGNAARCVGRCSALRRHLQRTAAFDRECSLVAGIAEGGGVHPPASQARGASLLVAQRCRHPGFCPSEYRSGRLQPLSPCRVPTAGEGWRGAAAALGMPEKESMAYALGRCHASLRLGYPVSNQN